MLVSSTNTDNDLQRIKEVSKYVANIAEHVEKANPSLTAKQDPNIQEIVDENLWHIAKSVGSNAIKHTIKAIQLLPQLLMAMEGNVDPKTLSNLVKGGLELQALQLAILKDTGKGAKLLFKIIKRSITLIIKGAKKALSKRDLPKQERREIKEMVKAAETVIQSDTPNQKQGQALLDKLHSSENEEGDDDDDYSSDDDDSSDDDSDDFTSSDDDSSYQNEKSSKRRNKKKKGTVTFPPYPKYKRNRNYTTLYLLLVFFILFTCVTIAVHFIPVTNYFTSK